MCLLPRRYRYVCLYESPDLGNCNSNGYQIMKCLELCHSLPRTGYSRRKHREPCRRVISFHLGLRVDRIYEHRIVWDNKLIDRNSEPYGQLSYESVRAVRHVATLLVILHS